MDDFGYVKKAYRDRREPPAPLRIEGIPEPPITPEPDGAERAASALLATLTVQTSIPPRKVTRGEAAEAYYQVLAERIREGQAMEERAATRWIAYCEQQLTLPSLSGHGSTERLAALERGLYERMDVIDRVGGELKRRWQHCLAEVVVRQMK